MNKISHVVAKNAGYLMASQVITWGFAFVNAIILPRYLGAIGIGKIQLANSIWTIAIIILTFGMDILLAKEIAREPAKLPDLIGVSIVLRSILFIFGLGAVTLYARLSGFTP